MTGAALEDPSVTEVRARALALLARREHSTAELRAKLRVKGCGRDAVAQALEALASEGLLSDARFAAAFVHARSERGQGPLRIEIELRQRGVPPGLVLAAISDAGVDWQALAQRVRHRRFGPAPRELRERARQARFLRHRGFTEEQIQGALAGERADYNDL